MSNKENNQYLNPIIISILEQLKISSLLVHLIEPEKYLGGYFESAENYFDLLKKCVLLLNFSDDQLNALIHDLSALLEKLKLKNQGLTAKIIEECPKRLNNILEKIFEKH